MDYTAKRYEGKGLLAIEPAALFEVFVVGGGTARENVEVPGATLVSVHGPLDQHASRWCDSYEAITARIAEACKLSAPAIVMLLDTPGGEAAGCVEAARDIRAMCDAAGKSLFAFVEDKAASAGYALASAAREIILAETAIVGSIGILQTRTDYSAMNAARGLNVQFIASGNRKAFGNPDAPLTEAEIKDTQQLVDSIADVFFQLVADMRGVPSDAIAQLQAGVFHGQAAIGAGLADAVMPLKTALASIARTQGQTAMAADGDKKKDDGGSDFEGARSALEKLAKGDDANAKRAKIALAALEAEGGDGDGDADKDKKAEGDDSEKKAEGDDCEKKAEGDDSSKDDSKKEDKTEAAIKLALSAERRVQKLEAKLQAKDEDAERAQLMAAHPDLSSSMVALLQKSPIKLVRETLAEIDADADADADAAPAPAGTKQPVSARAALAAASSRVKPTRTTREAGDSAVSHLPASAKADLDRRCGLTAQTSLGVRETECRLELGVITAVPQKQQTTAPEALDPEALKRKLHGAA